MKGFQNKCPNVSLTLDQAKADYIMEATENDRQNRYEITLFNNKGDAIYRTETIRVGNAMKDVCKVINSKK